MRSEHRHDATTVPLWMRRGTLWTILVLAVGAGALVAYYLLPMWWARLIAAWVAAMGSWGVGLTLGASLIILGALSGLVALRGTKQEHLPAVVAPEGEARTTWGERIRPVLAVVAGVCLVTLALTVSIAIGFTEPLAQARELWLEDAPGVLVWTLVGVLLGVVVLLIGAMGAARWSNRNLLRGPLDGGLAEPADDLES